MRQRLTHPPSRRALVSVPHGQGAALFTQQGATVKTDRPPILYGAIALAALSLAWSAYSITDLMDSGPYGLTVALAGDIGWVTVLWAEWRGLTIAGWKWAATAAGWLIAVGVAVLLVLHGAEHSRGQAVAGPFVVLVGKLVWAFALAAMKDPAALTPEQEAEINTVIRDSEHTARLHRALSDGAIARIKAEARTTLARDEADFEITLERVHKRAEITRRTPLALDPGTPQPSFDRVAEQAITVVGEQGEQPPCTPSMLANNPSGKPPNNPLNRPNVVPEQPSLADLVRDQIASTTNNSDAIRNVMTARPDANKDSVAAAVRRERRKTQQRDGYA